jgi:hypothetical protein
MVLRTALGAAAAAGALSLAPATGPVAAAPAPDPLESLVLHPEWGTVTGKAGVLKRGCHTYTYGYAITPPEGVWALEIFISGPGLKHLAAGAYLDGYDPTTGTGRYRLCRATTRYGTFRIEAKLSVDDGAGHITEGRLPMDTYRLHRPRR